MQECARWYRPSFVGISAHSHRKPSPASAPLSLQIYGRSGKVPDSSPPPQGRRLFPHLLPALPPFAPFRSSPERHSGTGWYSPACDGRRQRCSAPDTSPAYPCHRCGQPWLPAETGWDAPGAGSPPGSCAHNRPDSGRSAPRSWPPAVPFQKRTGFAQRSPVQNTLPSGCATGFSTAQMALPDALRQRHPFHR